MKNVLVLQGARLGAYHIGAYQALHELGFEPDWVTGISIGALNAAVLATNKPEERLRKMVEFWEDIARPDGAAASYSGAYRAMYNKSVVAKSMLQGLPNFWTPRVNVMMGMGGVEVQFANPTETSYYDTSPMLDTLRRHCNFAWHNQGHGARLSLGATRVDTGKLEFFDSLNCQIGPAHALASGSLPPGFPATEINGKYYWDGGCVTNTPCRRCWTTPMKPPTCACSWWTCGARMAACRPPWMAWPGGRKKSSTPAAWISTARCANTKAVRPPAAQPGMRRHSWFAARLGGRSAGPSPAQYRHPHHHLSSYWRRKLVQRCRVLGRLDQAPSRDGLCGHAGKA